VSSPRAAARARRILLDALASLSDFPERGHRVEPESLDLRELHVKFGKYGYAMRYRIMADEVFVTRIYHVRQAR